MVKIKGVEVDFPFKPYECQIAYMEKVITCLQEGKNGILESPTGTGKTLCLLCATLAWREAFAAQNQLNQNMNVDNIGAYEQKLMGELSGAVGNKSDWEETGVVSVPNIVYASRTHSQLSQAVGELKNTVYKPKVTVLGSRDQLCINPDVLSQESNTAKVHMCKTKVNARTCLYYNNLEVQKSNTQFSNGIHDIEDLVSLGNTNKVCPYYMSREMRTKSEIIFMPYNYILDSKTRKNQSIDLMNTILLIDEAHNLESVCEASSSFDLTSFDIASCVEDCDQCIKLLREAEELEQEMEAEITVDDVTIVKALFLKFEEKIAEITLVDGKTTLPGSYIFRLLGSMNISRQTKDQVIEAIDKCNSVLAKRGSSGAFGRRQFALQKFVDMLKIVFVQDSNDDEETIDMKQISQYYKVHVHINQKSSNQRANVWLKASSKEERTLSYWCFNPGLTMKEMMKQGVRSLILTSGTLSPIETFKAELGVPFDVELQNGHVINPNQLFVGVVSNGPDGSELCSTYEKRSNEVYQNSLGNAICNIVRIVPHGVLVFFPSYPLMDKCIGQWQTERIWERISQGKDPFIETKTKAAFNAAMEDFYKAIENPEKKGAIFFGVCRGKVSEGLDFADNNGRAVVITGLPYPPRMDSRVQLKMKYLDENRPRSGATCLDGRKWYTQQASRAVNQAVGRVIRHRQDYGAILLLDKRFGSKDCIAQLPGWMNRQVRVFHRFGEVHRETAAFFKAITQTTSLSTMRSQLNQNKYEAIEDANNHKHVDDDHAGKKGKLPVPTSSKSSASGSVSYNRDAAHSLAVIRAEDINHSGKKCLKTLFEYQDNYEKPQNHQAVKPKDNTNLEESQKKIFQKKTNFRIVMPTTDRNRPERVLERRKTKKFASAVEYINEAKKNLDKESFQILSGAITSFAKDKIVPKLIDGLVDAFKYRSEFFDLFSDFRQFFRRPEDKSKFDSICEEYRKKASSTTTDKRKDIVDTLEKPSPKRSRLDFLTLKEDPDNQTASTSREPGYTEIKEATGTSNINDQSNICKICNNRLQGSHKSPCGHVACIACWDKVIKETRQCHECHAPIKKKQLRRMYFM